MTCDLPPDDLLHRALLARDPAHDGRGFVGVTSTGIFCRLTCPARRPEAVNRRFVDSPAACLQAVARAAVARGRG
ncbi:MAG: Metal binding domain of Ada [Rhodobacteraceae bacterium HLUCCA08]|nr:MAG: Metal binding domain of Ada [Rhodobacteraceae bacterium HLUCCA08]